MRRLILFLTLCVVVAVASPHPLRTLVLDPADSAELRESGRSWGDHTTMPPEPTISRPPLLVMAIEHCARATFIAHWYVRRALAPAQPLSRVRHPLGDENPPPSRAALT